MISPPNITTSLSSYSCASGKWVERHEQIGATGVSAAPSVTLTPPAGEWIMIDSMFSGSDITTDLLTNNRTLLYKNNTGGELNAHQYYISSGATFQVLSYNTGGLSDDWCITALCMKEIDEPEIRYWNNILNQNIDLINPKKWTDVSEVNGKLTGN